MVAVFPEDVGDRVVVVLLAVGEVDGHRVEVLLEERLQLRLRVLFLHLVQLHIQHDIYQHIELACACAVVRVRVRWGVHTRPSRVRTKIEPHSDTM